MFAFTVFQAGELFGHPSHHAMLEVEGTDIDVTYVIMFSPDGYVYSNVSVCDWKEKLMRVA